MSPSTEVRPLDAEEERTWRALMRLMLQLPRVIDDEQLRRSGLSLTRYVVLMRLSEVPGGALRMSDLAEAATISPSRMTRIVQSMIAEGLVCREVMEGDGRASLARLTKSGLQRLHDAWPAHLAGVRSLVMDHIDRDDLADLNRITSRLLLGLEGGHTSNPGRKPPGSARASASRALP